MTVLTDKEWRSIGSMQSYSLKNSLRSTLLLLLSVAGAEKVNDLYIGLIVCFYNSRALIFIPGTCTWLLSKHDSSQLFDPRENIPNFLNVAFIVIRWCYLKKADSSFLHPNQLVPIYTQLIPWWHDLGSFWVPVTLLSNFSVNTAAVSSLGGHFATAASPPVLAA